MRTFVAIDPPSRIKQVVEELQRGLLPIEGLRRARPEQSHLTLKFLGEIHERQRDECIAGLSRIRQAPFSIRLAHLGSFPDARHPRVLWLGVSPSLELAALAQAVDLATGTIAKTSPFVPHLTLARLSGRAAKFDAAALEVPVPALEFAVEAFALYRSVPGPVGARHEVLQAFALKA